MITFRCKRSGNLMVVTKVDDIVAMRKHESYDEVKNEIKANEKASEGNVDCSIESKSCNETNAKDAKDGKIGKEVGKVLKKLGRPAIRI